MTNNEILKADLLDILFEHRNKSYGAYVLRRYYNNRLMTSLAIALASVVFLFLVSFMKRSQKKSFNMHMTDIPTVTVCPIGSIEKPKTPDQRKKVQSAQKDFQTIKIVKNEDADKPITEQKELVNVAISNTDVDGPPPEDPNKSVAATDTVTGTGQKQPEKQESVFIPEERRPSFPGGAEALALFFSRNLSSPTDLEAGEKKVILVRFVVGADGSITKAEVVQSGGDEYDSEVLRAFKRMPRWNPAIQNGIKVATSFTQPVTFVGVE